MNGQHKDNDSRIMPMQSGAILNICYNNGCNMSSLNISRFDCVNV